MPSSASSPTATDSAPLPSPTAPSTPSHDPSPTLHRRHSFHASPTSSEDPLPEALALDLASLTLGERDKEPELPKSDPSLAQEQYQGAAFAPVDEYYGAPFSAAYPLAGAFGGPPLPWGGPGVGALIGSGVGQLGTLSAEEQRVGPDGEPYPPTAPSTGPPGNGERRYGKTKFFNAQKVASWI